MLVKIPTAAGTNNNVHATCVPMMNDQMPPNFSVPPPLVMPWRPRLMELPVAFSAGSSPIITAATRASSSAYATVTGSSLRSTQKGRASPMI